MRFTKEDREFFTVPVEKLAQNLLGKTLCHKLKNGEIVKLKITATEAYTKGDGKICYGTEKDYKKNKSQMFYSVAHLCDYCDMLIISSTGDDIPDNVLIRSCDSTQESNADRPIKLRDYFWRNEIVENSDLLTSDTVWLEGKEIKKVNFCSHNRINIESDKKWLFCLQD